GTARATKSTRCPGTTRTTWPAAFGRSVWPARAIDAGRAGRAVGDARGDGPGDATPDAGKHRQQEPSVPRCAAVRPRWADSPAHRLRLHGRAGAAGVSGSVGVASAAGHAAILPGNAAGHLQHDP